MTFRLCFESFPKSNKKAILFDSEKDPVYYYYHTPASWFLIFFYFLLDLYRLNHFYILKFLLILHNTILDYAITFWNFEDSTMDFKISKITFSVFNKLHYRSIILQAFVSFHSTFVMAESNRLSQNSQTARRQTEKERHMTNRILR